METINFTIPFGDTSDPQKIATEIAESLQFCDWILKKSDDSVADEGIAATKFMIMGWTTKW
jgi:hypothetical protein